MGATSKAHYLIELKSLGDERGGLGVIESLKEFPFRIERIFYQYNTTNDVTRGNHANKDSRMGFVSVAGSCCVEVDDGAGKVAYLLDSPLKLLCVDKMTWKTIYNYSKDNVLLVLSDQKYCAEEYIKDYEEFLASAKGH